MPPPTIHVDGRCLEGQRTGIGVFTAEVVTRWPVPEELRVHGRGRGGPLWHLRTARAARRAGGRYLSSDSLIVPTLLGRSATVAVHDLAPVLHPGTQTLRTRAAYRLLLGLACRRVGAVVVPTLATAGDLVALHPRVKNRVHVVPYSSRTLPAGALPPGVRSPYVLHAGTHEPRKGVPALVEAFLEGAADEWQLVLAGRPGWLSEPDKQRLDALVSAGGDRVLRLGFVTDEELGALYAHASLFAYPSDYEGFGLPVLEAMVAGVPVLIADATAVVEVAGDAARVVGRGPGLADRLAEALKELTRDAAARAALVEAGRRRAAGFSWDRTAAGVRDAVLSTESAG
ncbi:MAG TPA: glycosyltransferase family 1 protein [Mycobacteriales bacterium]|nr:glycosyltransferase family 1 protein [Mycobacteriales bacterium]